MEKNVKFKKFIVFFVLIFFIIFISEASAEKKDILEDDGTDWTTYSNSLKIGYVGGFIAGAGVVKNKFSGWEDDLENEVSKELYKIYMNEISLVGITVGQIQDGVDAFYKDFSNRRIKIVDAIYVVKMQINGDDPELINAQIRYLKMQPIDLKIFDECHKKIKAFRNKKGRNPTYKEIKIGDFSFEDLLRGGRFIDASNNLHALFCYGLYK